MKILLIDNYDSFTYNLYHYISKFKKNVDVIRNDKIDSKTILRKKYNKIVISPGPGNPDQAGNCLKIVKDIHKKIPILGVCLGHQIIGQVFGGKIVKAKNLMHGKTSKIKHNKKGLFRNIQNNFQATRYHSLIVDKKNFPKDLIITAETNNKTIMGLMHKDYNIHGFQFHPESISTKMGMKLIKKGETKDELAGGIFVLRDKANKVKTDTNTIDTCGTGGDGQNSLNISTAAAIVLASMDVKVAKHGNKAVSSNCGSADVLEALKININLKPEEAENSIRKLNFAFMFAPNYHSAMKHVGPARKKMGKKTIFNLIGPLSSPAQVKRQVVGVFDKKWMKPFAEALRENNVVHAYIVHSNDGMDEISPFAKTNVVELKNNNINEFTIDPKELGINSNNKDNLKGKDAIYNSLKIIEIYKGTYNEFSQAVALNVAAGLIVSGKENNFKNAFEKAIEHLKSGNVFQYLAKIQST